MFISKERKFDNMKRYVRIIDDFVFRLKRQGCGCNVRGYGASYYDNHTKTFDPVGLVLGFDAIRKHFGVISAEDQKPLIIKLSRKYGVNIETDKEYASFVVFMQHLQDIHDFSFDEYYRVVGDRFDNYLNEMSLIRQKILKESHV